jgi:hypothetical protein
MVTYPHSIPPLTAATTRKLTAATAKVALVVKLIVSASSGYLLNSVRCKCNKNRIDQILST